MKRRATSQLNRDGNYEEAQPDEFVDVDVDTPSQIAQRKIYRARRPQRAPETEPGQKPGFRLNMPLLSKALEQALLAKPPSVDLSVFNDEIKEASPEKKPRTSSGFKSAGFADLIDGLKQHKADQVEALFLTSATPKSKAQSVTSFPSLHSTPQPPKLYHTLDSFECAISVNKADKGKGRLEFMINAADIKAAALVVFRNSIGNLLYQGYLSKTATATEASDITVEREDDTGDCEYALIAYRKTDKMQKEELRICLAPQKFEALQAVLKKIREA